MALRRAILEVFILTGFPFGRVAIIGASGFVGRALVRRLGSAAVPVTRATLELTSSRLDDDLLALEADAVINAAAIADVDRCDRESSLAWEVNAEAPGRLARACARAHLPFIHLSTDYVFGARPGSVHEPHDPPCPVNYYGHTKAEGERRVLEEYPEAIVARVAWVYGLDGRSFGSTLPSRLTSGASLSANANRRGHPTYVEDIAERLETLLSLRARGIAHVVNADSATWYEFAARLARQLGLPEGTVTPDRWEATTGRAPRPEAVALSLDASGSPSLPPLRPWQEAQDAFLRTFLAARVSQD